MGKRSMERATGKTKEQRITEAKTRPRHQDRSPGPTPEQLEKQALLAYLLNLQASAPSGIPKRVKITRQQF